MKNKKTGSVYIFDCNRMNYIGFRFKPFEIALTSIIVNSCINSIKFHFWFLISNTFACVLWPCNIKHNHKIDVFMKIRNVSLPFRRYTFWQFLKLTWALCFLSVRHMANFEFNVQTELFLYINRTEENEFSRV